MKLKENEYKELSENFCKVWNDMNIDKTEEEFLDAIDGILTFSKGDNGKSGLRDSYDAHMIYLEASKAIGKR